MENKNYSIKKINNFSEDMFVKDRETAKDLECFLNLNKSNENTKIKVQLLDDMGNIIECDKLVSHYDPLTNSIIIKNFL